MPTTMRNWLYIGLWMWALFFPCAHVFAADPLVDVDWIITNTKTTNIVFVDARSSAEYLRGHIPGAVSINFDKDGWRDTDKSTGVPGMFPQDEGVLAQLIGRLGIDNSTHVVFVVTGFNSLDMSTAARLYWTFKVLGHDNVSILNGGMEAYFSNVDKNGIPINPYESGVVQRPQKAFRISLRKSMLIDEPAVKAAMENGDILIDNRTADQYLGVNRSHSTKKAGTIPGAVNLPHTWLTENDSGLFRNKETLIKLYAVAGIPITGDQIYFCNTGHKASLGWFVSSEILGNRDARLYDGSMAAWTTKKMPIELKIKLP